MSEYILDLTAFDGETFDDGLREEIVRCRDCKHSEYCQFHRHSENKPDGFCAWGERKEAGE